MKKTLFIALALVLGQVAQADFFPNNTRLSSNVRSLHMNAIVKSPETTNIRVLFNGIVQKTVCNTKGLCSGSTIAKLDAYEMDRIERDIRMASRGRIIYPQVGGVHCLAIPTEQVTYRADGNQVLLREGTRPCGAMTYNSSPAASRLVQKLDGFLYGKPKFILHNEE